MDRDQHAWIQTLIDKLHAIEFEMQAERRRWKHELVRLTLVAAIAFCLGLLAR